MLELLAKKAPTGDLFINLAQRHLSNHDWGLARMAVEQGLAKGCLKDPDYAHQLLGDICRRLSIKSELCRSSRPPMHARNIDSTVLFAMATWIPSPMRRQIGPIDPLVYWSVILYTICIGTTIISNYTGLTTFAD